MSSEIQLKRIHEKLQVLVKQHQQLVSENRQLRTQLKESELMAEEQKQKVDQLEARLSILKAAAGPLNDADKKDLEKRLNHYLKEIDRCITMLSE